MITGENIVCVSSHYWHEPWFRKQHFMSRFAKENRVLYVEPSFSMARRPPKRVGGGIATNRFFKAHVETVSDNLFLLKPPRGLPKWSYPAISKVNYIWFAKMIDREAGKLGFKDYVLWVYHPVYSTVLGLMKYSKLVFDLTDDLVAYSGKKDRRYYYIKSCVEGLIRKSNLVIVTAKTLYDQYKTRLKENHIYHVSNGFDAELFSRQTGMLPQDLAPIKKPIIGFVGVLFKFLDYNLLQYIAKSNTDKSLVLVGPVEPSASEDVTQLKKLSNVFHLGKKPKESIPRYINHFDVCINPFRVDDVSRSANPLKVYEYLACGKPVVSTFMEALRREDIADEVEFANDYKSFVEKINYCLENNNPRKAQMRKERVQGYSWDNLFQKLNRIYTDVLRK